MSKPRRKNASKKITKENISWLKGTVGAGTDIKGKPRPNFVDDSPALDE